MKASLERGFTLIELVVVITILGILAAFAVPRFIALDTQARVAAISSLSGSVKSAASLARGLAMANASAAAGTVTMEGQTIQLANYYPDAATIAMAVNSTNGTVASGADFLFTAGSPAATGTATWQLNKSSGTCTVSYTPPASGATPVVTVSSAGC